MDVFVGQSRSRKWIRWLTDLGFGEVVQPFDSFPPRRSPWVLDNGAFADWQAGRPFSAEAWLTALSKAAAAPSPPAFGVCPDRVATVPLARALRIRAPRPVVLSGAGRNGG